MSRSIFQFVSIIAARERGIGPAAMWQKQALWPLGSEAVPGGGVWYGSRMSGWSGTVGSWIGWGRPRSGWVWGDGRTTAYMDVLVGVVETWLVGWGWI